MMDIDLWERGKGKYVKVATDDDRIEEKGHRRTRRV
jgi:hypothetical protein